MTVVQIRPEEGTVPPQNLEAEESVLGAMMLSEAAIAAVSEILEPEDFYRRDSHGRIYAAALSLYAKGSPVDVITLSDELAALGQLEAVGGRPKLAELAALTTATANAAHHATIVHEAATLRRLIDAGAELIRLGRERPGEIPEIVDRAEQVVFGIAQDRSVNEFFGIKELLTEGFARVTRLYESGAELTGTPSGFRALDRMTSGFQPGNLIVLAGRPSMGKSALALGIIANVAVRHETPVALFTLEMSRAEITQRLMALEGHVELQRIRNGNLEQSDWPRLAAVCDRLAKAPIFVSDNSAMTMLEIRAKSRRLKAQNATLGLVVVDYLQLMGGGSIEHRVQEVSLISRQLKVLARDLEVPVLALSQLNRGVEQRLDKRPLLSDLRESGAIEQDSDVVVFIYRDDYYNKDSPDAGLAELIVSKHRNGPTGTEKLGFVKRYARFADLQEVGG